MAIQILGADGNTTWVVDSVMGAARVSLRPGPVDAWSSYGVQTTAVSGLTSGATLFSMRNTGAKQIAVRRFQMHWLQTTAFTTPQRLEWALHIARSWSSADTGGVQLNTTSGKHRQALTALPADMRIHLAIPITAGTRTSDPHPIAVTSMWAAAVGATTSHVPLITTDAGDHPVVLGPSEGLVLTNSLAMGAAGAGIAYLNFELAEGQYP